MDYSNIAAAGGKLKNKFNSSGLMKFLTNIKTSAKTDVNKAFENFSLSVGKGYKKDKKRTNVGPGKVLNVRAGDSSADILAKILNFSQKTHELDKLYFEVEQSYRKEQQQEDERRHKKMMDLLSNRRMPRDSFYKKEKEEKELDFSKPISSLIDKIKGSFPVALIGTLFKMVGGIFTVIKGLVGAITAISTSLVSVISGVVNFLMEKTFLGAITILVRSLISVAIGSVLKMVGAALGTLARAALGSAAGAITATIAGILGVAIANEELDQNILRKLVDPDVYNTLKNEIPDLEFMRANIKQNEHRIRQLLGNQTEETLALTEAGQARLYDIQSLRNQNAVMQTFLSDVAKSGKSDKDYYEEKRIQMQEKQNAFLKSLIPEFKAAGIELDFETIQKGTWSDSLNKFVPITLPTFKMNGEAVSPTVALAQIGVSNLANEAIQSVRGSILEGKDKIAELASEAYKKTGTPKLIDDIKESMDKLRVQAENIAASIPTVINTTNVSGAPSQTVDASSLPARNNDDSLVFALRNGIVDY